MGRGVRGIILVGAVLSLLLGGQTVAPAGDTPPGPRLLVLIVVDGLSLQQFVKAYPFLGPDGFRWLVEHGAWLAGARYAHASTFTSPGFTTIVTGVHPRRHGILNNAWYHRGARRRMAAAVDGAYPLLHASVFGRGGASPRRLWVATFGDRLRRATGMRARVVAVGLKSYSSVLAAGKLGMAYFYNRFGGYFVTTTYYRRAYPQWWYRYYRVRPQNRWSGWTWTPLQAPPAGSWYGSVVGGYRVNFQGLGTDFPHVLAGPGRWRRYYAALTMTPVADAYTLEFARAVIDGEGLGRNPTGAPDVLIVALSTHDYVNHYLGPTSAEAFDHLLRLDRELARFLADLDARLGLARVLIALTADHGFTPAPEVCTARGRPAGRLDPNRLADQLERYLNQQYGVRDVVAYWRTPHVYLRHAALPRSPQRRRELLAAAARFLEARSGIRRVYTRADLARPTPPGADPMGRAVWYAWNRTRGGDLYVVPEPCWYLLRDPRGYAATHGTPYATDTRVPLLIAGPGVRAGRYSRPVHIVDLAPTLLRLLGFAPGPDLDGHVLTFILTAPGARMTRP